MKTIKINVTIFFWLSVERYWEVVPHCALVCDIYPPHVHVLWGVACVFVGLWLRGWGEYPGLGTFSSAGQVLKEVCFNHPNSSSYKPSHQTTLPSGAEWNKNCWLLKIILLYSLTHLFPVGTPWMSFTLQKKNNSNCCLCETLEEVWLH